MATETSSTGRESDKFMLRFPEGMRAVIKEAAEKNGRTMNAEIVARLQSSFQRDASEESEFQAWREVARMEREAKAPAVDSGAIAERAIKEYADRVETIIAAREERMREWLMKEFGYDPDAPQIPQANSKGPKPSPNAHRAVSTGQTVRVRKWNKPAE